MVTRQRVNTSGGVINAATTMITMIEWRRYFFINVALSIPSLASKNPNTGNWNTRPIVRHNEENVEIYDEMVIVLTTVSATWYVAKNLNAIGNRT